MSSSPRSIVGLAIQALAILGRSDPVGRRTLGGSCQPVEQLLGNLVAGDLLRFSVTPGHPLLVVGPAADRAAGR
jgi:hypothetical protein